MAIVVTPFGEQLGIILSFSAGQDQTDICSATINLIATVDGDLAGHTTLWEQVGGSAVIIDDPSALSTFYTVAGSGTKTFRFTLDKGETYEQFDEISVFDTPTSSFEGVGFPSGVGGTLPQGPVAFPVTVVNGGVANVPDPLTPELYGDTVLADNPIGHWRLDETSGTTAVDSISGYNGTYNPGTTLAQPSLITTGTSVDFDGSAGAGVDGISENALRIAGDVTMEAWVEFDAFVSNSYVMTCSGLETDSSGGAENYLWSLTITSAGFMRAFHENGLGVNNPVVSTHQITTGTVHHLVVVRDATAQTYTFFDNGVEYDTVGYATNPDGGANSITQIGKRIGGGESNARIDEVAVYDYGLSPSKIAEHYQSGKGELFTKGEANVTSTFTLTWDHPSQVNDPYIVQYGVIEATVPVADIPTVELSPSATGVAPSGPPSDPRSYALGAITSYEVSTKYNFHGFEETVVSDVFDFTGTPVDPVVAINDGQDGMSVPAGVGISFTRFSNEVIQGPQDPVSSMSLPSEISFSDTRFDTIALFTPTDDVESMSLPSQITFVPTRFDPSGIGGGGG